MTHGRMDWQRALWQNRAEAGAQLADHLAQWNHDANAIVIGLPRGGIVVAAEVAKRLHLPLKSWAVRKISHPSNPELALGAIAPGDVLIWDEPFERLDPEQRQQLVQQQQQELLRRQQLYGDPAPQSLKNHPLIVVDDGVATGLTVRAALRSLEQTAPQRLILAVPVIDQQIARALRPMVHELVALAEVTNLWAVGSWYQHFEAVADDQVIRLLNKADATGCR